MKTSCSSTPIPTIDIATSFIPARASISTGTSERGVINFISKVPCSKVLLFGNIPQLTLGLAAAGTVILTDLEVLFGVGKASTTVNDNS